MKDIIERLKEFKAADDSAKEMEETIKEAIEQLQEKDKIIDLMAEEICFFDIDLLANFDNEIQCVEYFTKKAREV